MEQNVYDLINDFYSQDAGWNEVLRQSDLEALMRTKSWQGAGDDELIELWDDITVLFIYLGNAELLLSEMHKDAFIDCVGWCARNVAEFRMEKEYVTAFLTHLEELYAFMKKKHILTTDRGLSSAKKELLADGELQLYDEQGKYLPFVKRLYIVQDLPSKIFLNADERMQSLQEEMHDFFEARAYEHDLNYARFLYADIMPPELKVEPEDGKEYEMAFWEYFIFDYHMMISQERPLEIYYEHLRKSKKKDTLAINMLEELLKAKLIFFTVEKTVEQGVYQCRNFFTGEQYVLPLPFETDAPVEKLLFSGHIFYQNSMMLNSVRGVLLKQTLQKRFYRDVKEIKEWRAYIYGGELSWEDFIGEYPSFLRHMALVYAVIPNIVKLKLEVPTAEAVYTMKGIRQDDVTALIGQKMMQLGLLPEFIVQASMMWSDYSSLSFVDGKKGKDAEIIAAAIILLWSDVAGVPRVQEEQNDFICGDADRESIQQLRANIEEVLDIRYPDPRYILEPGLLKYLLS